MDFWNTGGAQGGQSPYPNQAGGYPPANPQPGYPSGQPNYPQGPYQGAQPGQSQGYLPGQPQGYPPGQPQAFPPGQPQGYPPGQPQGYPPGQPQGYPPGQPQGYPPGQPQGFPPGQPQGLPPSQPYGYPPQGAPQGYPQGHQAGYAPGPQPGYNQGQAGQSQGPAGHTKPPTTGSSQTKQQNITPTLRPAANFDPMADCERLRKAMKGIGTDENAITDVMTHRSVDQRTKLVVQFKTMYGKDLLSDFNSELSRDYLQTIIGLCYSKEEFLARELRNAISGVGTNERTLIEVLASQDNSGIAGIKDKYQKLFKHKLEDDLISETSSNFKRVLVSLVQGNRDESTHVDQQLARQDAERLHQAGEQRWGTDESTFNMILVARSYAHLRAVFLEYQQISKSGIEEAIKKEMSGDLEDAYLAIVRCIQNTPAFFAFELNRVMKGAGTRDTALIRMIISRCEIDMGTIKTEFARQFGKSLEARVQSETSGHYRKALISLITG